jgi:apolipoprotein N-acyltransferase
VNKIHPVFLSALSGLLLFAAWPVSPLTFLIFVAFVPLLWLEQRSTRAARFFGLVYLSMLIWNGATTWWVCNSTLPGGIAAIMANSLLMSIPWLGFYKIKKRMGPVYGYSALILFWLSFEYIHLNWELSWPWLTLGNVFATHPGWVQWYEFTGTSGGSLWVLAVNVLIFLFLNRPAGKGRPGPRYPVIYLILFGGLLILLPVVSRLLTPAGPSVAAAPTPATTSAPRLNSADPGTEATDIVIVQPNIDPYEKFAPGNQEAELRKLIGLSETKIDSNTALVIWPETAIAGPIDESDMKDDAVMAMVWAFLHRHPNIDLLSGVEGYRNFNAENKTPYSFKLPNRDEYQDSYNSAVLLDSNSAQIYHKSKLVPGVETLPSFMKFMAPLFEKFGGTTGGYAQQKERTVLLTTNNSYRIAPSVCYESIYGEFMSAYVRNGADLLAVITNDGWWGKTSGYRQHESYARLRAIETRRWVVRSANTGISCFIDPSGQVIDPQPWDKAVAIRMMVPRSTIMTFYVRHGDILSRLAIGLTGILILWWILFTFLKKKDSRERKGAHERKGSYG